MPPASADYKEKGSFIEVDGMKTCTTPQLQGMYLTAGAEYFISRQDRAYNGIDRHSGSL